MLRAAAERGLIDADAVARLTEAYRFLRQLEHRLQYIEDAQTHNLPGSPEDQLRVAHMMGFDDYAALVTKLEAYQDEVAKHFEQTFSDKQDSQPPCAAATARPSRSVNKIGRQSAVMITQTRPGCMVIAASAVGGTR